MNKFGIVISGTTRGIGKEIMGLYSRSHFVVSVNRGDEKSLSTLKITASDNSATVNGDILDPKTWMAVKKFCIQNSIEIEKVFFNAGVNKSDHTIDAARSFIENSEVNFISVATAINAIGVNGSKKFIVLSSMSTIYPNEKNISYALSKISCEALFSHLNRYTRASNFQVLRLGPVNTEFSRETACENSMFKALAFKIVALDSKDCAKLIHYYAQTNKKIVNIPFRSLLIYLILKWLRLFLRPHKSFLFPS